jgi:hypothetical protein
VALLRPGMRVINRTPWYGDAEVRRIVASNFRGEPGRPVTIIVSGRTLPSDTREGFTPFDRRLPVELWVEPPYRYPEPGARSWREELALSAAHESWHWHHPDRACPDGICERRAERYAHAEYRRLQRRRRRAA